MSLLLTPVLGCVDLRDRVVVPRQNDIAVQKRCEHLLKNSSGVVAVRVRAEFLTDAIPQMSSSVRDMILDRLVQFRSDGFIDFTISRRDCPIERRSIPVEVVRIQRSASPKLVSIRAALLLLDNSVGRYLLEEVEVPDIYGGSAVNAVDPKSSLPNHMQIAHAQNARAVESAEAIAELQRQLAESQKNLKALQMQRDRDAINEASGPVEVDAKPEPEPVKPAPAPPEPVTEGAPPPPRSARSK